MVRLCFTIGQPLTQSTGLWSRENLSRRNAYIKSIGRHLQDDGLAVSFSFHLQHQSTRLFSIIHRLQLNHEELAQHLVVEGFDHGIIALPTQTLLQIFGIVFIQKGSQLYNVGTRPIY